MVDLHRCSGLKREQLEPVQILSALSYNSCIVSEISMLVYSNQINLFEMLNTVHCIILSRTFFFALFFSYVKQTDLPARISTLERENVELKEKVKAIQGNFQSERGKGNFRKNNCAF